MEDLWVNNVCVHKQLKHLYHPASFLPPLSVALAKKRGKQIKDSQVDIDSRSQSRSRQPGKQEIGGHCLIHLPNLQMLQVVGFKTARWVTTQNA